MTRKRPTWRELAARVLSPDTRRAAAELGARVALDVHATAGRAIDRAAGELHDQVGRAIAGALERIGRR